MLIVDNYLVCPYTCYGYYETFNVITYLLHYENIMFHVSL